MKQTNIQKTPQSLHPWSPCLTLVWSPLKTVIRFLMLKSSTSCVGTGNQERTTNFLKQLTGISRIWLRNVVVFKVRGSKSIHGWCSTKIAKFFPISTDEMCDVTSKEQVLLVACFYDNHQIEESFFFAFWCYIWLDWRTSCRLDY